MRITIDKTEYEVEQVISPTETRPATIRCADGSVFCLAESEAEAGGFAWAHWQDMAMYDPREFISLVGEDRIVQWGLQADDGNGQTSLNDFLDNARRYPEETLGERCVIGPDVDEELIDRLGFTPGVAYACFIAYPI